MGEALEFNTNLEGGLLTIQLDRPVKMNALTRNGVTALKGIVDRAAQNQDVRCLMLTGAGAAFCAGRDLSDARHNEDATEILRDSINPLILALYEFPKPTVAAVNGAAMGIGLGLALACDIVIAGESAVFSSPFAKLGGALDSGGHYFLSKLIGVNRTFEMIYLGDRVNGRRAAEWGLVNRVVSDELLLAVAKNLANRIAAGPAEAFGRQKAILRSDDSSRLELLLDREAIAQGELSKTSDYAEGLVAFRERRPPQFGKNSKNEAGESQL